MNNVIIIGRLTKDPEIRYTQNGTAIARFNVAVDRPTKGEKKTDFINCKAFGKTAENMSKYTEKGKKIAVNGSIETGSYENNEGRTIYTTDVSAFNVEFLEWKETEKSEKHSSASEWETMGFEEISDDDIPF